MLGTFIYIKAEYLHIYATARWQFRVFRIDFAEYATNCTPAAVFCENRALFHECLSNTLSFPTFYSMKKNVAPYRLSMFSARGVKSGADLVVEYAAPQVRGCYKHAPI
jgi:hypothetical protein